MSSVASSRACLGAARARPVRHDPTTAPQGRHACAAERPPHRAAPSTRVWSRRCLHATCASTRRELPRQRRRRPRRNSQPRQDFFGKNAGRTFGVKDGIAGQQFFLEGPRSGDIGAPIPRPHGDTGLDIAYGRHGGWFHKPLSRELKNELARRGHQVRSRLAALDFRANHGRRCKRQRDLPAGLPLKLAGDGLHTALNGARAQNFHGAWSGI